MIEKLIKGVTKVADIPVVEGMPDVLEAEDQQVIFMPRAQVWKYGTAGQGVDVMRLVWPKETHVFSCQTRDISASLPGRPLVQLELGPPKKVKAHVLDLYPVDFLFINDEDPSVGSKWINRASVCNRPSAFIWMGLADSLSEESNGPIAKHIHKDLERAGYHLQYWLLSSNKLGSGVGDAWEPVQCMDDLGLPRRSMSNLLMPVGVPRKAWHSGLIQTTSRAERWWPCEVTHESEGDPVFERTGLMPDRPHLQLQELIKGKGVPPEWIVGDGFSQPL
jgi:hypothetical protein